MTSDSHEPPPGDGEQPTYRQQPYGQQQYAPPPGGYAPPPPGAVPYVPPRRRRGLGIVGLTLAVVGAVAVLLAFLNFRWFRSGANNPTFRHANRSRFNQLHRHLDSLQHQLSGNPGARYVHLGVAPDYFSWLGWLLFGVAVALAVLAVLPIRGGAIARVLGVLAGLAGAGFTVWAVDLIRVTGPIQRQLGSRAPGFGDWISHTYVGAWLAFGGFLLLAIASATGSRRTAG